MQTRWYWNLAALLGLIVVLGCSHKPDPRPKTVPVTVTVNYRGKPVQGVTVALIPPKPLSTDVHAASGVTDEDGVVTPAAFNEKGGVVPGTYKVTIAAVQSTPIPKKTQSQSSLYYTRRSLVPLRYATIQTSKLEAVIKADESNRLTFDLID